MLVRIGNTRIPETARRSPNAGINLTGYHSPGPLIFFSKSPLRTAFQCKTPAPGSRKRHKMPIPGHNLSSSNAKISTKKQHNSIREVSFQIFHNCPFDNFFYRENKIFVSLYRTVKINTAIMQ